MKRAGSGSRQHLRLGASLLAFGAALAAPGLANAQQSTAPQEPSPEENEVIVTGYRASLRSSIDTKRNADVMLDAITAEDIADFPDANLAESLQRLPGMAIDRDNGEGRSITVRGLGSDFTRVRLNGIETLSTAASSDSGTSPNRGRGFDFNTFASELFSSLTVRKTASAETDEGSLGATVDLVTGRAFNFDERTFGISIEDAYYENGEFHNPRIAGLFADQFANDTIGVSFSVAYSQRDSEIDRYRRQPGQFDYLYRGSTFTGTNAPNWNGVGSATQILNRQGFSAPTGTPCSGTGGVVPNATINSFACSVMSGSDPTAYNLLNGGTYGQLVQDTNAGSGVTTTVVGAGPLARIPALLNIEEQVLEQERLGLTGSFQWRPTERTLLNLDMVYSRFEQASEVNQIQSVGLNRNNTNATFQGTGSPTVAQRRATYATCTSQTATAYRDAIDCGGTAAMPGGVFAGLGTTSFSTNPYNLDPYDYYNNPSSVGYIPSANGMAMRDAFIGRPAVDVLAAHLNAAGDADYLELRGVDWRSATDASYFTTTFQQISLNLQQEITDSLSFDFIYGYSSSLNENDGQLVEFNRMDSPETFVYDERGGGSMPALNYGFDLANPGNWSIVKGFSAIRHFIRDTDNRYEGGHLNFEWEFSDNLALEFGMSQRRYRFSTNQGQRLTNETLNPTLLELGLSATDLGQVYNFGQGLDMPAGTPTSFFAPNISAWRSQIGFDCNCVNQYGDWRVSYLSNPANQFGVLEDDESYFVQLDMDLDLFGRRFFGNIGVRQADTSVVATGYTPSVGSGTSAGPRQLTAQNRYSDFLPSVNLAYEVMDDVLLRFGAAKVMARPLLGNLAPSITSLSTPSSLGSIGSLTIGNPELDPFRATNYDLSVEWYFAEGGLLSVAIFSKDISNFPQTISYEGFIQDLLTADEYTAYYALLTSQQQAWLDGGGVYSIRQFANAPGGTIDGIEISYQQDLTFLPGFLSNLGIQLNYTRLESELQYIVDPGTTPGQTGTPRPMVTAPGPFTGASPTSYNATIYYETDHLSARLSAAYRDEYVTNYPVASGTCDPGFCDSPLVNDFLGSESTLNWDASVSYELGDHLTFTLEALNLTDQTDNRWGYQGSHFVTQYASTGRQLFAGLRYRY